MATADTKLSGIEKASVLLMSLNTDASQAILDRLSPQEREILGAQIVRMRSVQSVVRDSVLSEVPTAIKSLNRASTQPLIWLEQHSPDRVAESIASERPHTIALVISHLSSGFAARVLSCLKECLRDRVAKCLSSLGTASEDVVKSIDELLRERLMSGKLSSLKLNSLDELTALPDHSIRLLLGNVDLDDLGLALRVASEELIEAMFRNMPSATVQLIRDRLQSTDRVKIREIEAAQRRVLEEIKRSASSLGGVI